jgi:hypothetical protein
VLGCLGTVRCIPERFNRPSENKCGKEMPIHRSVVVALVVLVTLQMPANADEKLDKELFKAAERGKIERVQELLTKGASVLANPTCCGLLITLRRPVLCTR